MSQKPFAAAVLLPTLYATIYLFAKAPKTNWVGVAFLVVIVGLFWLTIQLGSAADYWRMRSREFFDEREQLINEGVIKWNRKYDTKREY